MDAAPSGAVLREWRIALAVAVVALGWCLGLLAFGGPVDGGFGRAIPFGALPMGAFAVAVVVCEARRSGGGHKGPVSRSPPAAGCSCGASQWPASPAAPSGDTWAASAWIQVTRA